MGSFKPWHDKSFLYNLYVVKRKSIDEIAEECKKMGHTVTPMTIYNNLKKLNIPIRGGSRNLGKRSVGGNSKGKGGFYG